MVPQRTNDGPHRTVQGLSKGRSSRAVSGAASDRPETVLGAVQGPVEGPHRPHIAAVGPSPALEFGVGSLDAVGKMACTLWVFSPARLAPASPIVQVRATREPRGIPKASGPAGLGESQSDPSLTGLSLRAFQNGFPDSRRLWTIEVAASTNSKRSRSCISKCAVPQRCAKCASRRRHAALKKVDHRHAKTANSAAPVAEASRSFAAQHHATKPSTAGADRYVV
mmetsp:Transcript_26769/g.90100  ORF Transcript_26769/g.90100 Transcript_26769/m.90100 type:complete len:224 (-) Transcript_26769:1025-1696(-)